MEPWTAASLAALAVALVLALLRLRRHAARLALERALRTRAEAHLATLLESIPDHLAFYDRDWRFVAVNEAAAAVLGKPVPELLGQCIWELFPDAVGNQYYQELHAAAAQRKVIRSEHYYATFDRWFCNHIYPAREGVLVFSTDITEHKRSVEQAQRARDLLRLAADLIPALVCYVDRDGYYRFNNAAYARWFRRPVEEITGRRIDEVVHPQVWRQFQPLLARALTGEPVEYEYEVPSPSGMAWVRGSLVPDRDASGTIGGVVAVVHDITRRKQYEQSLLEADRRKDEFLATLAHELRNPLAPIANAVAMLSREGADAGPAAQARAIIERQVAHMARLVDDLLDVARVATNKVVLQRQRVALSSIIDAALEAVQPLAAVAGHRIATTMPDATTRLDGDPARLVQVLTNLLNNAIKFTPAGGEIRLEASIEGAEACLCVRDSGVGIPSERLQDVFEMFLQLTPALERQHGGLGIGLSLVRGLVELHGGRIEARSDGPGHGSAFLVWLPLATGAGPADDAAARGGRPAAAPAPADADGAQLDIVVVDDNVDAAQSLAMLLEDRGHRCWTAHDGPQGLALVQDVRPQLAFIDIGLPGLNGYETARRIRAALQDDAPTLVALTGWGRERDRAAALEAGFDHHFTKPIELDAVQSLIAAGASQRRCRSPA